MTSAAVHSKGMIMLLMIHCLLLFLLCVCVGGGEGGVGSLFILSSFAIILPRKRELVLLYLCSPCHVTVCSSF